MSLPYSRNAFRIFSPSIVNRPYITSGVSQPFHITYFSTPYGWPLLPSSEISITDHLTPAGRCRCRASLTGDLVVFQTTFTCTCTYSILRDYMCCMQGENDATHSHIHKGTRELLRNTCSSGPHTIYPELCMRCGIGLFKSVKDLGEENFGGLQRLPAKRMHTWISDIRKPPPDLLMIDIRLNL